LNLLYPVIKLHLNFIVIMMYALSVYFLFSAQFTFYIKKILPLFSNG